MHFAAITGARLVLDFFSRINVDWIAGGGKLLSLRLQAAAI
jgi:hypothetical protein